MPNAAMTMHDIGKTVEGDALLFWGVHKSNDNPIPITGQESGETLKLLARAYIVCRYVPLPNKPNKNEKIELGKVLEQGVKALEGGKPTTAQFDEVVQSFSAIMRNPSEDFVKSILTGLLDSVRLGVFGKYSMRALIQSGGGQSSFYADENVRARPVRGVCSRTMADRSEILWDGHAGALAHVAFLFTCFCGVSVLEDLLRNGIFYHVLGDMLEGDVTELDATIGVLREALQKTPGRVPVGLANIFVPVNDKDYVAVSPVISGNVQFRLRDIAIESMMARKNGGIRVDIAMLKKGGSRPQNLGYMNAKLTGIHDRLSSDMRAGFSDSSNSVGISSGQNIFDFLWKSEDYRPIMLMIAGSAEKSRSEGVLNKYAADALEKAFITIASAAATQLDDFFKKFDASGKPNSSLSPMVREIAESRSNGAQYTQVVQNAFLRRMNWDGIFSDAMKKLYISTTYHVFEV